jgi:hypothetical protein
MRESLGTVWIGAGSEEGMSSSAAPTWLGVHLAMLWHQPEIRLVSWGFALNGLWETLQTPLYADSGREPSYLLWTRLHCTAGDLLILLGCFWAVAALRRDRRWFCRPRRLSAPLFVGLGMAYTAASELYNTRVAHAWAYAPQMPRVLGVGLGPLLQWLLLPPVLLHLLRRSSASA